jgi:para-nitrobenzyl esterase
LPAHPFYAKAAAISADVPLIVGYNRTESTLFAADPFSLDEAGMQARIKQLLGNNAGQVIEVYRKANPKATPSETFIDISTDYPTMAYSVDIAERKAALGKAPAYMYRFDWATPILGGKYRSPHALELAFVFDNISVAPGYSGGGPEAAALAARMSEAWISFATTGDPNTKKSGLPHWPAYDSQTRATMLFDNQSRVESDPQGERRKVLQSLLG